MRFQIIVCCLLFAVLAACSDDPIDRAHLVDQGDADAITDHDSDVPLSDSESSAPDAADTAESEQCVCSAASACCDGCQPIGVGAGCDDGLSCTTGTTCQPDGQCAGSMGSPCDAALGDPQCQAASCDETLGCAAVQNVREGFACDDGDEQTQDDICRDGACVGAACACAGEDACCDGCNIIADNGAACDDGDGDTDRSTCQQGQCVGEVCECDAGACCDGCHWTPGVVCGGMTRWRCSSDSCGSSVIEERSDLLCIESDWNDSGDYYCEDQLRGWHEADSTQCAQNEKCSSEGSYALCVPSTDC